MKLPIRIVPLPEAAIALPENLGFGRHFTRRMFTQKFSAEHGWNDAEIGAYRPLERDPATEIFHSGQMIFDGAKAYRRPDGHLNLFRPEENARRFNRSAQRMAMSQASGCRPTCRCDNRIGALGAGVDAIARGRGSIRSACHAVDGCHTRGSRQPQFFALHYLESGRALFRRWF